MLSARGRDIDSQIPGDHDGRMEPLVRVHAPTESGGQRLRERDPVAFHRQIDIEARRIQQQVAHRSTHEIHPVDGLRGDPHRSPQWFELRALAKRISKIRVPLIRGFGRPPAERCQQVCARDHAQHIGRGRVAVGLGRDDRDPTTAGLHDRMLDLGQGGVG